MKSMKLERLLAIVILLMNREKATAKELSEIFEVSGRTIQRDMEAINLAGIPVVSYQGPKGGYGIIKEYRIDKSFITDSEYQLLLTALKGVNQAYQDRKIQNMIEKLTVIKHADQTKGDGIIFDFSSWGDSARRKEKTALVKRAIEEQRIIQFEYHNLKGHSTTRCIEPYTLLLKVNNWYVYGYCQMREAFRLFKLSRATDLILGKESFVPRQEIPPLTLDDTDDREVVKLNLRFNPSALNRLEDLFDLEELTYAQDGYIYVSVSYPEDEWVYGMLLSFGDMVQVLEPPHIKKILRERAEKIIEIYQQ